MRAAPRASAARSPFDNKWYAHIDGKTYGPYSGHEVKRLIGQCKILGTDFLCREGGEEWIEAKNDRILGAFFQPSGDSRLHLTEMGRVLDEAESEKSSRGRRINVVLALVAAIILGWIAWPYYTLYELSVAVREGDSAALENRVEWESVRQGLRGDLNAMMLQKISADAKAGNSSAGAGFAAILGPAIINQLVEGCHSAGRG